MHDPRWFSVRQVDGQAQVAGTPRCTLGHQLPPRAAGAAPDGLFAQWDWDGAALTARNDRFGFYPLFYCQAGDRFLISPALVTLIQQGAPTELDPEALAVFFRWGSFLHEDTPFRAIKVLPPDAVLRWSAGKVTLTCGARPTGRLCPMGRDEAIDRYIALFRQAIRRRLDPKRPFAMPLSGGQDSRHILLELLAAEARPQYCLTGSFFPPRPSADVDLARRLAATLGLRHEVVGYPPRFGAELAANVECHFASTKHAWLLPVRDRLVQTVPVSYDGIAGDVLSAGFLQTPETLALYEAGKFRDLADKLMPPGEESLEVMLDPATRRAATREVARTRIAAELERYASAPNPYAMFIFWNRTRRDIGLMACGLLRELETVYCPYLDHELYDFLSGLPIALLRDRQFHVDTIRRAHPQYADIPFATFGARVPSFRHTLNFTWRLLAYTLRKQPTWFWRHRELLGRKWRIRRDPAYRATQSWLVLTGLLYPLQLEVLAATRRPW